MQTFNDCKRKWDKSLRKLTQNKQKKTIVLKPERKEKKKESKLNPQKNGF